MNRASTTNGHPAASALTQGGYDAYFAQVEQGTDETAGAPGAGAAATGGQPPAAAAPPAAIAPPPQNGPSAPTQTDGPASDLGQSPPLPAQGKSPQSVAGPASDQSAAAPVQGQSVAGPASGPSAQSAAGTTSAPPAQSAAKPAPDGGRSQTDGRTPAVATTGQEISGPPPVGAAPAGAAPPPADTAGQWQGGPAAGYSYSSSPAHTQFQGRPEPMPPQGYSPRGAPVGANGDPAHLLERVARPAYDNRAAVLPPALASPDLLADIAAVRQAHLRSNSGMRGALNKVGFSFGLSPAEQRAEQRRNQVRRALTTPYQIAVVSVKGGVGRTTTTAALGSIFARMRPDRVAAVDANPDFGDLSTRTVRHPYGLTLRDLATAAHSLDSFSSVHAYTAVNSADLAVVASPWNTDATDALSGTEYGTAVQTLRKHYNLLLVDCGTGVFDSATDMVLRSSDAVLVVTPATVGGVTGAVATLNWLSSHGFDHLIAASMVAIVHHQPVKPTVDVEAIEKLFASAQRPTCRIPYDAHLAEGGEVDLRLLEKETALAFEELAAGLSDDFPGYDVGPAGAGGRL